MENITTKWYPVISNKKRAFIEEIQLNSRPKINKYENENKNEKISKNNKKEKYINSNELKKIKCGLCEYLFKRENLKGIVTINSIWKLREKWGLKLPENKSKWKTSYLYSQVRVCKFCMQLFLPNVKDVILPDPPSIFINYQPYHNKIVPVIGFENELNTNDFNKYYTKLKKSKKVYKKFINNYVKKEQSDEYLIKNNKIPTDQEFISSAVKDINKIPEPFSRKNAVKELSKEYSHKLIYSNSEYSDDYLDKCIYLFIINSIKK